VITIPTKKRDPKTINAISKEFNLLVAGVLFYCSTVTGAALLTIVTVDEKLVTYPIADKSKPPLFIPFDN